MASDNAAVVLTLVGTVMGALLLGVGLISQAHWLTAIGLVLVPAATVLAVLPGYPGRAAPGR